MSLLRVVWILLILLVGCARHSPARSAAASSGSAEPGASPRDADFASEEAASEAPPEAPAAPAAAPAPPAPGNAMGSPAPAKTSVMTGSTEGGANKPASGNAADGGEARAPLLIYTAEVVLAVFNVGPTLDAVEELARTAGGYLVLRDDTRIVVRVPKGRFQSSLSGVGKLGDELHREISANDVTEAYADLEVRLRNSEAMRQRLETLLAKANTVEDALAVERELERVAQNIEQLKGKLKLMNELIAFSTITVECRARAPVAGSSKVNLPFNWLRELGLSNLLSL